MGVLFSALLLVACSKKDAPAKSLTATPVPAVAPAAAPASSQTQEIPRFTAEIVAHQEYQKIFAPNLTFRLEPYAGTDSGWTIRIAPVFPTGGPAIDCIGAIATTLHGDTTMEIEPPENGASKARAWRQREFAYVATEADCKRAWELMNDANYGSKLSETEREQASTKLSQLPTAHGKFTILDARFGPATPQNAHGTIERLKFQVELSGSSAPPAAPSAPTKSAPSGANPAIRAVDLQRFLETHYREVQPDLQAEPDIDLLKEECGENQEPIRSLAPFQYGDLDGDGQEEAVYQGFTCMSGTAGVDFFGVLKMMPDGRIAALPIEGERKEFKGRKNIYDGLRGHLSLVIRDARLVETHPVYTGNEANCCPEGGQRNFVYRWDGHQFVLDDIIDAPPEKGGT